MFLEIQFTSLIDLRIKKGENENTHWFCRICIYSSQNLYFQNKHLLFLLFLNKYSNRFTSSLCLSKKYCSVSYILPLLDDFSLILFKKFNKVLKIVLTILPMVHITSPWVIYL